MKVGIVGSGFVGATAAYALVMRGIGRQIVLLDKNTARAEAEADDILHAVPFAHALEVFAGDYPDLAGARIVIITAGVNQQPGESRPELLGRNAAVFSEIVPRILEHAPDAILLVATNPVDAMTHLTARLAAAHGGRASRVLGSGTTLDTARFRALLGRLLQIDPQHVHAYVIGEHGDSEVLTWSLVTIGGIPLTDFCEPREVLIDESVRATIDQAVRGAAYHIIKGKSATYYGVGSAITRVVDVVLRDQRAVLTVCSPADEVQGVKDVTLSLPRVVGGDGVLSTLPLGLDLDEAGRLAHSASTVRAAIDGLI
jgi:L-lactate dehydrogenase